MQDLRALERRVERLELAVFGHSSSRTTTTQRHHAHMYRQALERQASQGSILSQLAHLSLQWKRIQREHPELRLFLQKSTLRKKKEKSDRMDEFKVKQHGSLFKVHEAGRARLIQVNSSLDWRTKVEVLRLGEHDLFRFLDGLHQCKSLSFVLDIPQLTSTC